MKEEEIIAYLKLKVNITKKQIEDGSLFLYVEDTKKEINAIQGLLDLYNKEKEKNKELLEGLKYRVNYCKLLEKELYEDTDMEYEMELTKIEQKYIQELLNKEE